MRRLPLVALVPLTLLAACGLPPQQPGGPVATAPSEAAPAGQPQTPILIELSGLKGLSSTEVTAALGRPGFKRRDAPAEIWQYRVPLCTLDLFLYDHDGGPQVAHASLRGPETPVDEKACLGELSARSRGVPTS